MLASVPASTVNRKPNDLGTPNRSSLNSSRTVGKARNPLLQSRLVERIEAVLPMPDAPVMLALLDRLASA